MLPTIKRELATSLWLGLACTLLGMAISYRMTLQGANLALLGFWTFAMLWLLSFEPVRNFSYRKRWTLILVVAISLASLVYLAWGHPLPSKDEVRTELSGLVKAKSWVDLNARLNELEDSGEYRDLWLLYRGRYAMLDNKQDPERYLSLIRVDNEYFGDAQWLRLRNFVAYRADSQGYLSRLLESLESSRYFRPVYYRLKLGDQRLSHDQLQSLFKEFKLLNGDIYNFDEMRSQVVVQEGVPSTTSLRDFWAMPGLVALFAYRLSEAAHRECREKQMDDAIAMLDKVYMNNSTDFLNSSLGTIWVTTELRQLADDIKASPRSCRAR